MNVGVKPTFHDNMLQPTLEIHLLDYSGDLYGETLSVQLIHFIREERKFKGIDELVSQITKDAMTARELLQPID
ncbi:RNA-binding riboflavin kinase RibR [compost metagenome]